MAKVYYRIVNSKGDQIGPLYDRHHAAIRKVDAYSKEKRGNWQRYVIECVKLAVVWSDRDTSFDE